MIGAHELLLIIRGQNQASAALGRVARDIRGLQRQRDLRARQATLVNRAAAQALRVQQMENAAGSRNFALKQARLRIDHQIAAVTDRTAGLELRRAGIVARGNQLLRQEERIKSQILGLDDKDFQARTRILQAEQRLIRTQQAIAGLARGRIAGGQLVQEPGIQRAQAALRAQRAQTSAMQAEIQRDIANMRATAARAAEGGDVGGIAGRRADVAERRFREAQEGARIAKQSVRELAQVEKDLLRTEQIQQRQVQELRAARASLAREEKQLIAQLQGVKDAWAQLSARERQVQAAEAQHIRLIEDLQARLRALGIQELELAQQSKIASEQLRLQQAEIADLNRTIAAQKWENFATGARAVSHIGRVLQMTGLIATAAFGAMAVASANFSKQATLAATQARKPGQSIAAVAGISRRVQSEIIKQMQQFPASAEEMSNAFYEIFSGTNIQKVERASEMVRVFNQMAVAGGTDLKTMTDAGISMFNNFPREFKNMTQAGNAFFAAVRFGRMNAEQFAGSLSNILPIAKAAGLHFRDVADAMALLTRESGAKFTGRDATALARMIQVLGRPEMVAGLQNMGVQVKNARGQMRPLLDIINDIVKARPDLKEGGLAALNFFKTISASGGAGSRGFQGTINAARAFAYLVQNTKEYGKVSKQVNNDNNEMQESFKALSRDPGVQWRVFTNQLKALILVIGQGAIPAMVSMAKPLSDFARYIEHLSPHTRRLIGYLGAITAVGTLVAGSLAVIVGSVGSMIITFRSLITWLGRGSTAMTGLKTGSLAAEEGFSLVGLAMRGSLIGGLLIAVPLMIKYHKQINGIVQSLGGWRDLVIALGIAFSALKLGAYIRSLEALGIAEGTSIAATSRLLMLLRRLMALGLITVVVEVILHRKQIDKFVTEWLQGHHLGFLAGVHKINIPLGATPQDIRNMLDHAKAVHADELVIRGLEKTYRGMAGSAKDAATAAQKFIETGKGNPQNNPLVRQAIEVIKYYRQLRDMHMDPKVLPFIVRTHFKGEIDKRDIGAFIDQAARFYKQQLDRLTRETKQASQDFLRDRMLPKVGRPDPNAQPLNALANLPIEGGITTQEFRKAMQRLNELRANAERSGRATQWQRYFTQLEALMKRVSSVQQSTLEQIGTLTDQQVFKMARRVAQLKAVWQRAPSLANWNAYYAAQQALAEQTTQRQQALVQQVGTLTDQEVIRMVQRATQLRAAFEKAPDPQHWRAWKAAMDAITSQATEDQQQMANDVQKISDSQVMQQVRNINRLAGIANKSKSFADIKAYNVALQSLQNSATSTQMSTAQNFLVNLDTTMKKATKTVTDNVQNAKQALQNIAGTLSSTFDSMQQQNQQAFGTLFQGPVVQGPRMQWRMQYGYKPTGRDYLADLRAMLSRFKQWQRVLQQLRARGAPYDLIEQIRAMGPDALPAARALLGMQRPEFQQYVKVFSQSQKVVAQASKQDMNRTLAHWRSLGSSIMKAILQGMDEHTAEFANYFRNLAIELFPGLAKMAKAKPRAAIDPVAVAGQPQHPSHAPHHGRAPHHPTQRHPHGTTVGGRALQVAVSPRVTLTAPTRHLTQIANTSNAHYQQMHVSHVRVIKQQVPMAGRALAPVREYVRPQRTERPVQIYRAQNITNNYNTYETKYIYEGGQMDYSTWLQKSRSHLRNRR